MALSPAVPARRPSAGGQIFLPSGKRLVFESRSHRVVPAVEEPEHRNDADNLYDLLFRPALVHLDKHLIRNSVRYRCSCDSNIEGRTLSLSIKRARLIIPDCRGLLLVHSKMHGAFDRMRHAVLASGSAACDVCEEALETAIDLAL